MGIAAAVEQKKWTKKAAEIAYFAIPLAIIALWIYPVIWFRKRRKVIKLISEYMVN